MIKIVEGDLLKADIDIIAHQVNCQGVMGSGIAKSIREQYPEVYRNYKILCNKYKPEQMLGIYQLVECHNGRHVANLFGQLNYGYGNTFTDYDAFKKSINNLAQRAKQYHYSIGLPFKIGCCRGGGDWDRIYKIIEDAFGDYDVFLYRLDLN